MRVLRAPRGTRWLAGFLRARGVRRLPRPTQWHVVGPARANAQSRTRHTARAWRENLERRREEVLPVLERTYGLDADRWFHRWRLFFLACEELFGYRNGTEWMVGHYIFSKRTDR